MVNDSSRKIKNIILNTEMIMYGSVSIGISDRDDGTHIWWFACADGGIVVSDDEMVVKGQDFDAFANHLIECFICEETEEMNIQWGIGFADENGILFEEIEYGFWNRDGLEKIICEIETFARSNKPIEDLREMCSW